MRKIICGILVFIGLLIIGKISIKKAVLTGTLTDIDGNLYHTIKIGKQIWMVENLKTTRLNNGKAITEIRNERVWGTTKEAGYCWYNFQNQNKQAWGAYYNWEAVKSGQLAPKGWHVPTKKDWECLIQTLGGCNIAGGELKDTGARYWLSPNVAATNSSGFTAIPNGIIDKMGFDFEGGYACYYSSFQLPNGDILAYVLQNFDGKIQGRAYQKNIGLPVRCVKDN